MEPIEASIQSNNMSRGMVSKDVRHIESLTMQITEYISTLHDTISMVADSFSPFVDTSRFSQQPGNVPSDSESMSLHAEQLTNIVRGIRHAIQRLNDLNAGADF